VTPPEEGAPESATPFAEHATSAVGAAPRGDRIHRTIGAIVESRVYLLERARKLARRLGVQVTLDRTGWSRGEIQIEVMIQRAPDGTIDPTGVRLAPDATDQAVLGPDGVRARCEQYNARLRTLYQLADRMAELVRRARALPRPGSPLEYAHLQLTQLGELIARRQAVTMGYGTVSLATLAREIEWFGRCDAHLAPIVVAAERSAAVTAAQETATLRAKRRRGPG